jgi:hypothetical protein
MNGDELHGRDVTGDAFYEWLLSDHPDARAERDWRRAATYQAETDRAAAVRAWADKINAQPDAPQTLRDLAASVGPLADQSAARAEAALCRTRRRLRHPAARPARDPRAGLRAARLLGLPLPRPPDRARRRRRPATTRTRRPHARTRGGHMIRPKAPGARRRAQSGSSPPAARSRLPQAPPAPAMIPSCGSPAPRRTSHRPRPSAADARTGRSAWRAPSSAARPTASGAGSISTPSTTRRTRRDRAPDRTPGSQSGLPGHDCEPGPIPPART